MALLDRITVDSGKCGGKPCIRGVRVRVTDVLELLADGMTAAEIVQQLPWLETEDVRACLVYAATRLDLPATAAR